MAGPGQQRVSVLQYIQVLIEHLLTRVDCEAFA
jgi:hypothetical protein